MPTNPPSWTVDYETMLRDFVGLPVDQFNAAVAACFRFAWAEVYEKMSDRPSDLCVFEHGTFSYAFDFYDSFQNTQHPRYDVHQEGRLVVAFGLSTRNLLPRDDSRLKGWCGPTESHFGKEWDKGHFIGHRMGGAVNQCEVNVFPQLRALNRGRSAEGKRFVAMERYCRKNPGTFCFHRPLYEDGLARPAQLEFGYIDGDRRIVASVFENRLAIAAPSTILGSNAAAVPSM